MESKIKKIGMFIAVLWISISAFAYDFEADGIYYNITSMAELEAEVTYKQLDFTGYNYYDNSTYSGAVTIPSSVNYMNRTFSVIGIGESAFGGSEGYSGANRYCYGKGSDVESISLPKTIRYISKNAFLNCSSLTGINIPQTVTNVGDFAFAKTSLLMIDLSSVEEIGEYSFDQCTQLKSVIFGKELKSIGNWAFAYCSSLLEVFYTGMNKPTENEYSFYASSQYIEKCVPSIKTYGFGREYVAFQKSSFDYTGQSHNIEWTNNLKAYKCVISESECQTDVNAGQYTKNLKATYSNGVDFSVEIPYEYTINKAPMTLSVNDAQREYGEPNPLFTCNISGFVNGENEQMLGITPAFECEATQLSKVGDYTILASLDAKNYEIKYEYGTLSVLKAPLTATVLDDTKIYGSENPEFSFSYLGLKNNETAPEWSKAPKFSTTATVASVVGQYTVNASDGIALNYDITKYNSGTLTVSKRNLTAKANDCERYYGEDNPQFGISYIGFVNGDTESSLNQKPIAECNATMSSNAGIYPIVVTGGEAENYSFVYQDGSLKVNPLTVGFKDVYNSVTYNDMSISTNDLYFNYIPEIVGPFSEDDFWIELSFLDGDNRYPEHHAITINEGDYVGNYVNTNLDRPMWAGKYIFDLTSKGTNPNVVANPSRAFLTVNTASNNLEWNVLSPISVKVGEKVDLGITYQANFCCTFNIDYDEEIISLSSDEETGNNPHWFATGLKEGETTLYFSIECGKNEMGFYDFSDSQTLSKRIVVEKSSGIENATNDENSTSIMTKGGSIHLINKKLDAVVRVYAINGKIIAETSENVIRNLPCGFYFVKVGSKSFKVAIR